MKYLNLNYSRPSVPYLWKRIKLYRKIKSIYSGTAANFVVIRVRTESTWTYFVL